MNKTQAKGYLLEIVLSKLIEINGYELIRYANGDDIRKLSNGLNVKGRGGFHQFDTLGKFKITPPFIYPLRLFVEAKFYSSKKEKKAKKVGIDIVRAGIGILQDVNTNYSTVDMNKDELNIERYNYNYAVFSASGFTEPAQRLAIAHKIHLIDLSGHEYKRILYLIKDIVDLYFNYFPNGDSDAFGNFKKEFTSLLFDKNETVCAKCEKNFGHSEKFVF